MGHSMIGRQLGRLGEYEDLVYGGSWISSIMRRSNHHHRTKTADMLNLSWRTKTSIVL